jgi:pimeloyl-ACP methyl ester carboxylesterase
MESYFVFKYKDGMCGFTSTLESEKALVLVPGLGDRVFSLAYIDDLRCACHSKGVALVHFEMRSLPHYGLHLISEDVEDIRDVHRFLLEIYREVMFLGHSTGCQDLLLYARELELPTTFVLQGPVSDREYELSVNPELEAQLEIARSTEGVLPFTHRGEFVRGDRFVDLFSRGGKEDLFSLGQEVDGKKSPHALHFLISGEDEYLVVDAFLLKERLEMFPGCTNVRIIGGADHGITRGRAEFIEIIKGLL